MIWRLRAISQVGALRLDVDIEGVGGTLALVGPNGSGKTTLLRIIAGAHRPDEGEFVVDGQTLLSTRGGVDVPIERRGIGYVPQGYGLFPHLKVVDNVAFGLSTGVRRQARQSRREAARGALEALECGHLVDRMPATLSGGEKQRVALARALVIEPGLLLLDEPMSALDATARRAIRGFLAQKLRALGKPSIVVTHDVRDVEALDARVCVLERGEIVQRGTLEALRASPETDFVAEFVGV